MIALYIRLSLSDKALDVKKEDSNRVVNQGSFLHDVGKDHTDFAG